MCLRQNQSKNNDRMSPNTSTNSNGQSAGSNLYPELNEFFNEFGSQAGENPGNGNTNTNPAFRNMLSGLMVLWNNFQESQQQQQQPPPEQNPQPSAPPSPEQESASSPPPTQPEPQPQPQQTSNQQERPQYHSGGWWWVPQGQEQRFQQDHGYGTFSRHQRGNRGPHFADEVARRMDMFAANLAGTFASILTSCAFFIPLLVLPHSLLALGLFAAVIKSLGWPLKQLFFAGFLMLVLMSVSPCLLQIGAAYAIVKTCFWKKPLLNREYWNRRCHSSRNNQ